ncbi:unnamed protein product [Closterium sp. NIES-64]|nr:unnamed protein product [Closterium sp. NIES-64]
MSFSETHLAQCPSLASATRVFPFFEPLSLFNFSPHPLRPVPHPLPPTPIPFRLSPIPFRLPHIPFRLSPIPFRLPPHPLPPAPPSPSTYPQSPPAPIPHGSGAAAASGNHRPRDVRPSSSHQPICHCHSDPSGVGGSNRRAADSGGARPYFMRTIPNDGADMHAIAALLLRYKWRQVVAVYTDNHFGRNGITALVTYLLADKALDVHIVQRVPVKSTWTADDVAQALAASKAVDSSVYVLHASSTMSALILDTASKVGMMGKNYVWITSEGAAQANTSTLQSREGLITTLLSTSLLSSLLVHPSSFSPTSYPSHPSLPQGLIIKTSYLRPSQCLAAFKQRWRQVSVQQFPEAAEEGPKTYSLAAVSLTRHGDVQADATEVLNVVNPTAIRAYQQFVNVSRGEGNGRFSGCCIDLFRAAAAMLPYALHYEFVLYGEDNLTEMVLAVYDGVIGDITVMETRNTAVFFTYPIFVSRLTIRSPSGLGVMGYAVENASPWLAFQPFTVGMWSVTLALCMVAGLITSFLEHQSNQAFRGKLHRRLQNAAWFDLQNLYSIMGEWVPPLVGASIGECLYWWVPLLVGASIGGSRN